MIDPILLTVDDVVELHARQLARHGGLAGLRDRAGLESAVAAPAATFDGIYLHPTIPEIAAAYLFYLCQAHSFVDGNKRVAAYAALMLLRLNDWRPLFDEDELADLVLGVASGVVSKAKLTSTFEDRCRPISPTDD